MEGPKLIAVAVADGVATITLDRPTRLNAFTAEMGVELFGTIADLDANDAVRVIVVTGRGRAFCAGADLDPSGSTFGDSDFAQSAKREFAVQPWLLDTPMIAAINGAAVGIGATMPLSWDLRIASDRARFAFPFTRRGITPEAGSTWILPRLVGMSAALDLMLTGRTISAHEAHALGIVSRVVAHDELRTVVAHIAKDIATNTAPVAVALTKKLLWQQLSDPDPVRARAREDAAFHWTSDQAETVEGVQSFMEKRPPVWPTSAPADVPTDLLEDRIEGRGRGGSD
ncbi:MAG: enoyl-CoA hydratase-related protein [Myxococcota bacterium]